MDISCPMTHGLDRMYGPAALFSSDTHIANATAVLDVCDV